MSRPTAGSASPIPCNRRRQRCIRPRRKSRPLCLTIACAITTGKLDKQAYSGVSGNLRNLAGAGPWRAQTGVDFLKKTAEEIPLVGKLLKALWS